VGLCRPGAYTHTAPKSFPMFKDGFLFIIQVCTTSNTPWCCALWLCLSRSVLCECDCAYNFKHTACSHESGVSVHLNRLSRAPPQCARAGRCGVRLPYTRHVNGLATTGHTLRLCEMRNCVWLFSVLCNVLHIYCTSPTSAHHVCDTHGLHDISPTLG